MSTLKTVNLQHASAASPAIVLAANGSATAQLSSINGGPLAGSRNRIINGDMRIDQRNAGAAVTTSTAYPVDRTRVDNATDGAFSAQQSTTAPAGFTHSLACTITTADTSLAASQYMFLMQQIEGNNIADLDWGKATAKSVTVSFWVRSSITGNFGASLANDGNNRSYPFTYSISTANTWEYKTITIPGDTSGTWLTTNGVGIKVIFSLGAGSTYKGTASTWAGSLYFAPTSSVDLVGTLNATFYITGVQLEAGTVATPFERIDYSESLRRCQRYFQKSWDTNSPIGTITYNGSFRYNAGASRSTVPFRTQMRTAAGSYVIYSNVTGASGQLRNNSTGADVPGGVTDGGESCIALTATGTSTGQDVSFHWTASAEL